jgi:diguanylate cyclase (GGDEF)-like protein
MDLDIRTIIVIFSTLMLLFSGLLLLAGLHVEAIRGVKHWATANLCIGLGLSVAYFYTSTALVNESAIVASATLIATGISLQLAGIQAFKQQHCNWRIVLLIVAIALAQNVWFVVIYPDLSNRAVANSLLFAIIYAVCARKLLIQVESPLRTAYWFTGLSFLLLVVIMLSRAIAIGVSSVDNFDIYISTPINQLTFFLACMIQLCVTFGFLLMLNYRLITGLKKISSRDALTGTHNRRSLEAQAARLKASCLRSGDSLSIMMIDVDHFKSINDSFGHPVGDAVLCRLVEVAHSSIRPDDYFARYGGEEFCMLLRFTSEDEAWRLAERLRQTYAALILNIGDKKVRFTVSIGVADSKTVGLDLSALVSAADQALYRAKQDGRNRVVAYSSMEKTLDA